MAAMMKQLKTRCQFQIVTERADSRTRNGGPRESAEIGLLVDDHDDHDDH
jgi:hypothetical protein